MFQWKTLPDTSRMVFESASGPYPGLVMQMNTAYKLLTPEFVTCLCLWNSWNAHNTLPYSGGKWEQPGHVNEILDLFDSVYSRWSSTS